MWNDEIWTDKDTLNSGNPVNDGDGISAEVFNQIVENIFYLAKEMVVKTQ